MTNSVAENPFMVDKETLCLRGEVTFKTVANLVNQLPKLLTPNIQAMNVKNVTAIDSAAIAFLFFSLKQAKLNGIDIKIIEITDPFKRLIKLYGLEDFFLS